MRQDHLFDCGNIKNFEAWLDMDDIQIYPSTYNVRDDVLDRVGTIPPELSGFNLLELLAQTERADHE